MNADSPGAERVSEYWDWLSVALFLLVTVDLLTTLFAAAVVGPHAEANPLVQWALVRGTGLLVTLNLVAVVLTVVFFHATIEMLEQTPARYQRAFGVIIELWIGALLFAGLFIFANNLATIYLGESLILW